MPDRTDPELVRAVATAEAARPLAAYSQAVVAGGFVFCSGTAGVDPETGDIPEGIREQTELAFANLAAILHAAGSSLQHVVKTTVLYTDVADFPVINEVYAGMFDEPYPARTAPGNVTFPRGIRISIDAIAVLPADPTAR